MMEAQKKLEKETEEHKKELVEAEKKLMEEAEEQEREMIEAQRKLEEELKYQLEEHEKELKELREKLSEVESSKAVLLQRMKGLKSGISRKRKSEEVRKDQEQLAEEHREPTSRNEKGTNTDIHGAMKNEIIVAESEIENEKLKAVGVFVGKRYYGERDKKATSGHTNKYFEIPKVLPCSQVKKQEIRRRCKGVNHFAKQMSGSASEEDRGILYTDLIRTNKALFRGCLEEAGFQLLKKITPDDAVAMQTLLRMTRSKFRNLSLCLSNLKANPLPSERQTDKVRKPMTSHLDGDAVESGYMGLRKTRACETVTQSAYICVKSLKKLIEEIIDHDKHGFRDDERFNDEWWSNFGGDKGGNYMKYHLEIINSNNSGSPDNVYIYCMFEAHDFVENMEKVWTYREQVKAMYEPTFKVKGKKLRIFVGGDFHYLYDQLGHQGATAKYPCIYDKVDQDHLNHKSHGGSPHTPKDCSFEERTVKDYKLNYQANLSDTRNEGKPNQMHLNGSFHDSVCGQMLFPLESLSQVVPASLHILLGVVLLIYNRLLKICQDIDKQGYAHKIQKEKEELNKKWEKESSTLADQEDELRSLGVNVIFMANRLSRYEAVEQGDEKANMQLAAASDSRRKSKRKVNVNKCSAEFCIVTQYDLNVTWIDCSSCEKRYHSMCEGRTPVEEIATDGEYNCTDCTGHEKISEVINCKIEALLNEEDSLNDIIVESRKRCDDLKAAYVKHVGPYEQALLDALDSLNVVRQAYHGNVMVGNHCHKVLKGFPSLTAVLLREDEREKFNTVFRIFDSIMELVLAKPGIEDFRI